MKRNLTVIGTITVIMSWNCAPSYGVMTGQYLFEEGSGTTALDSSGFGRNGTLTDSPGTGAPTYTSGLYLGSTKALLFNPANGIDMQRVDLPDNQNFIRNAPGATIMAWIRYDGAIPFGSGLFPTIAQVNNTDASGHNGHGNARAALSDSHNFGIRSVGSLVNEARNGANGTSGNCRDTPGCPVTGTTYFAVAVFDYVNGTNSVYINGVEAVKNFNVPGWSGNSADTANLDASIGAAPDPLDSSILAWHGAIDGVRIFNTALDATTIQTTFNAERFPGDYNGNGTVDAADYVVWRRLMDGGQTYTPDYLTADGTGPDGTPDGIVDSRDFDFWRAHFGNSLTSSGSGSVFGAAVPEPATWTMLMSLAALVGMSRRKSQIEVN